MAITTKFRYTNVPGSSNQFLNYYRKNYTPAYASAIVLSPTDEKTDIWIECTGALSLTINTTASASGELGPFQGDEVRIFFTPNGSSTETVTFSTGFGGLASGTLATAQNYASCIAFVFNGTTWQELYRVIGAA